MSKQVADLGETFNSDDAHQLSTVQMLALKWRQRAAALELKPGTKKYQDAQINYVVGAAQAAVILTGNAQWLDIVAMTVSVGSDLSDFL